MTIEELQQQWQSVKSEPRSHRDLRRMMYASPALRMRNISRQEGVRFIRYLLILVGLTWAFDLLSDLSTAIPIVYAAFLLVDEYVGLRYMRFIPQEATLQRSLQDSLSFIHRAVVFSRVAHGAMWLSVVVVLYFAIPLSPTAAVGWAIALLPFAVAINWWSSRKWSRKVAEVKMMLKELNDEADFAGSFQS